MNKIFAALMIIVVSGAATAGTYHTCINKPLPLLRKGCEKMQCETPVYTKAVKTVSVYRDHSLKSPAVDHLAKCEVFKEFQPWSVIQKFGRGTIQQISVIKIEINDDGGEHTVMKDDPKIKGLAVSDSVDLIRNEGGGFYEACAGHSEFEATTGSLSDSGVMVQITADSENQFDIWIKLKTPRGRIGYVPMSENFYFSDPSGWPVETCPGDTPVGGPVRPPVAPTAKPTAEVPGTMTPPPPPN